ARGARASVQSRAAHRPLGPKTRRPALHELARRNRSQTTTRHTRIRVLRGVAESHPPRQTAEPGRRAARRHPLSIGPFPADAPAQTREAFRRHLSQRASVLGRRKIRRALRSLRLATLPLSPHL